MSEPGQSSVIDVTPGGDIGPSPSLISVSHAVYACYAVGFFIGVTWLIGVIVAYVKRDEARGTPGGDKLAWLSRRGSIDIWDSSSQRKTLPWLTPVANRDIRSDKIIYLSRC